jgi:hypothetical protein
MLASVYALRATCRSSASNSMLSRYAFLVGCAVAALPLLAQAEDSTCQSVQVDNQRRDEDTVRRIERAWLAAEYAGNTKFLDCLLDQGYSVIASGENKSSTKAELLERVAKNAGKPAEPPPIETLVALNGDFAIATSLVRGHRKNGEAFEFRAVDSFVFKNGVWHALAGVDIY